jgi:hypothetical protein
MIIKFGIAKIGNCRFISKTKLKYVLAFNNHYNIWFDFNEVDELPIYDKC